MKIIIEVPSTGTVQTYHETVDNNRRNTLKVFGVLVDYTIKATEFTPWFQTTVEQKSGPDVNYTVQRDGEFIRIEDGTNTLEMEWRSVSYNRRGRGRDEEPSIELEDASWNGTEMDAWDAGTYKAICGFLYDLYFGEYDIRIATF